MGSARRPGREGVPGQHWGTGADLVGGTGSRFEPPVCESPVAVASDAIGTLRVICGASASDLGAPWTGIARLLEGNAIDLNEAPLLLLQSLPEIGPVRAANIVRARDQAPFASVADLERVSGIGPKTRAKVERWLFVDERPRASTSDPSRNRNDG